jgi:hypothetical protein
VLDANIEYGPRGAAKIGATELLKFHMQIGEQANPDSLMWLAAIHNQHETAEWLATEYKLEITPTDDTIDNIILNDAVDTVIK